MSVDKERGMDNPGLPPHGRSNTPISRTRKFVFILIIFLLVSSLRTFSLANPLEEVSWLDWISWKDLPQPQLSHGLPEFEVPANISTAKAPKKEICGPARIITGPYDSHWWSGGSQVQRYPFEYNRHSQEFRDAGEFHRSLYNKDRVQADLMFKDLRDNARLGAIGDPRYVRGPPRETNAPPVSRLSLPQWYPTELEYRVTAVWRAILTIAMERKLDDPVAWYLANQVLKPNMDSVQTAQFPPEVRYLLGNNSAKIHTGGVGKTWIGMDRVIKDKFTPPFPRIEVGYDTRIGTWQKGAGGPFSIEAAFILATQVAGVNFKAVALKVQQSGRMEAWWTGVLMPKGKQKLSCFDEQDASKRLYGKYQTSGNQGQHDTRAGVYVVFDLDHEENDDLEKNDHNVFVFIVHAADGNSVIQTTKESYLREVGITRYIPSQGKEDAFFWGPTGSSRTMPKVPKATPDPHTRQVAHAHAGVFKRSKFIEWVQSKHDPTLLPQYAQISYLHLYILTEDWDVSTADLRHWPRKYWFSRLPRTP